MDIRTGKTYATREEALAAGVPKSDLAWYVVEPDGEPKPTFAKLKFSKGSFKEAGVKKRRKLQKEDANG